jgi:hypothetical protein
MPDYLITTTIPPNGSEFQGVQGADSAKRERLVRAKNEAAAIKHVVADTITVTRATIDDAMRLAQAGVKVETAGDGQ